MSAERDIPEFLFVCGAVGSGNSFMFSCLTQDVNVYGINEDGLGYTLNRLITSEREVGKCPHSIRSFNEFMYSLRGDRQTLILKTPSNIRHKEKLLELFPNSYFITMIREPRAAIASGIPRHGKSVEEVAKLWLSDNQFIPQLKSNSVVITFDNLVRDPVSTLNYVSNSLMPLSSEVLKFADRIKRPERADPKWWHSKVDESVQVEIEHWVDKLHLDEYYENASNSSKFAGQVAGVKSQDGRTGFISKSWTSIKRLFFLVWYKIIKKYT